MRRTRCLILWEKHFSAANLKIKLLTYVWTHSVKTTYILMLLPLVLRAIKNNIHVCAKMQHLSVQLCTVYTFPVCVWTRRMVLWWLPTASNLTLLPKRFSPNFLRALFPHHHHHHCWYCLPYSTFVWHIFITNIIVYQWASLGMGIILFIDIINIITSLP